MQIRSATIALVFLLAPALAPGAVAYTDSAAFLSALGGPPVVSDFEAFDAPELLSNPFELNGMTIGVTLGVLPAGGGGPIPLPEVTDHTPQTTAGGANSLGTDDLFGAFLAGDSIQMSFASPVNALGLFVIAPAFDDVQAGALRLSMNGSSVENGIDPDRTLSDGLDDFDAFFLGLVETAPGVGYSSAVLESFDLGGTLFIFNVDDISYTVVPLPSALPLFAGALLPMLAGVRRRASGRCRRDPCEAAGC